MRNLTRLTPPYRLAIPELIDAAGYFEFALLDRGTQDRPCGFSLATVSITFCLMALPSKSPGSCDTAFTADVRPATSDGI